MVHDAISGAVYRAVDGGIRGGTGKHRVIPFEPSDGLTLVGMHHFDLLNHPKIYAKLREWLEQPAGSVLNTA